MAVKGLIVYESSGLVPCGAVLEHVCCHRQKSLQRDRSFCLLLTDATDAPWWHFSHRLPVPVVEECSSCSGMSQTRCS